ncbi:MSCRAMM family protein [Nocardia carnea]|uniref:MSCRAMM family protein n=1 Tax=Nocardia carnea TaxID=37328 RepID=UPI0024546E38|nr:carboxypeptidase-like regulatory domain-containing protein [Nocardia carnea]
MAEAVPAAPAGLSAEAEQVVDDAAAAAIPVAGDGVAAAGPRHPAPDTPAARDGESEPAPQPSGSGSVLFGRVSDTRGGAVAGATLTLISPAGRQLGRARSGPDGFYELAAPAPGSYVLIASAEGRRPDASTAVLGSNPVSYDVTLSALTGLEGTVLRAGDGTPVSAAMITALDLRGEVMAAGESDTTGRFELTGLPEGDFTIAVSAFGYHPTAVSAQVTGRDTARVEVLLRPGVRVTGVINGGGRPLAGALVTLTDSLGNVIESRTTDADGSYTFGNLAEGSYTVVATGYAPASAQVRVGEQDVEGFDMELRAGGAEEPAGPVETETEQFDDLPEVHKSSW